MIAATVGWFHCGILRHPGADMQLRHAQWLHGDWSRLWLLDADPHFAATLYRSSAGFVMADMELTAPGWHCRT